MLWLLYMVPGMVMFLMNSIEARANQEWWRYNLWASLWILCLWVMAWPVLAVIYIFLKLTE